MLLLSPCISSSSCLASITPHDSTQKWSPSMLNVSCTLLLLGSYRGGTEAFSSFVMLFKILLHAQFTFMWDCLCDHKKKCYNRVLAYNDLTSTESCLLLRRSRKRPLSSRWAGKTIYSRQESRRDPLLADREARPSSHREE
jgi:hypothetical protein